MQSRYVIESLVYCICCSVRASLDRAKKYLNTSIANMAMVQQQRHFRTKKHRRAGVTSRLCSSFGIQFNNPRISSTGCCIPVPQTFGYYQSGAVCSYHHPNARKTHWPLLQKLSSHLRRSNPLHSSLEPRRRRGEKRQLKPARREPHPHILTHPTAFRE